MFICRHKGSRTLCTAGCGHAASPSFSQPTYSVRVSEAITPSPGSTHVRHAFPPDAVRRRRAPAPLAPPWPRLHHAAASPKLWQPLISQAWGWLPWASPRRRKTTSLGRSATATCRQPWRRRRRRAVVAALRYTTTPVRPLAVEKSTYSS
eukprot:363231-Chlamydomonas_euryale.AAC.6